MAEKEYIDLYECRDDFYATVLDILSEDSTNDRANQIIDAFDYLPTADVAPVKHGHFRRLTFSGDTIICSECKMAYNIFETNGAENFNFCPHCGVKIMDGGEEE